MRLIILQYFQSVAMVQGFKSTPHRNSDTVATPICPSVKIDFISPVDSGEAIFHPVFTDVDTSLLTVSQKFHIKK